ncbi:uncharacterized protein [Cicer arietinum]|uniref:Uncharacterized protein LOC101491614 n=1 Tax=Cicer arietinum TaxID=3827 RepID=A0A1S2YRB8_CICAR|nr:uncharacterized protein LOC101491614 [Cicer arietinum]
MEKDQVQEFKHACKFCNKSFPCGRSLGGHMRSHINNLSSETEQKEKLPIKKLPSLTNNNGGSGGSCIGSEAATNAGYVLRENPKKTWRISDSSEDNLLDVYDKLCKECGRSFVSWKALFGHMKCHSDKERVCNSLEDQDSSWTNNNVNSKMMIMDSSQSDNEITTAPNKRRRSKRTRTRYMVAAAAATTSSLSFANIPSYSSLSEVEQEQEEVAMSLIMLSKDVSPWSGLQSLATAESSDNNSPYFEPRTRSSVRTNLVTKFDANNNSSITATINIAKLMKKSEHNKCELGNSVSKNFNFKGKSLEILDTDKGFRMNKVTKSELDYLSTTLEDSEVENGKNRVNGRRTESVLSKKKLLDSELKSSSLKNCVNKPFHDEDEFIKNNSNKRGKFECTTCNKIFHSYQALGGHRASHKKTKGCFASKIENSENSIETDLSPEQTVAAYVKHGHNNISLSRGLGRSEYVEKIADTVKETKKIKGHECPICFKVFQSGQALGGHKRSHMVAAGVVSESRVVVHEQVPQIRDFLDLNLPAATEEESNSHADSNRPWWIVEGNHKQEELVG